LRGDCILELDWSVGELLNELEKSGMREKTLIVFCSDNGPVLDDGYADEAIEKNGDHRPAGPFKGGKYSAYEGGTRTPFIASWPGRIKPGVSDEVIATIDLYASLAALTGAAPETVASARDSVNLVGALLGEAGAAGREELVQQENNGQGTFGFRSGSWKLLRHDGGKARNLVVESLLANTEVPRYQLFDLSTDPGEEHDLFATQAEVGQRLIKRLEEIVGMGPGAERAQTEPR
jgi:arylsulfatase A-like enzyme